MEQRVAVAVIMATTTCLTLLALAGHTPWTGRQLFTISGSHGVNSGDVLPLAGWAVISACCVAIWRRAE